MSRQMYRITTFDARYFSKFSTDQLEQQYTVALDSYKAMNRFIDEHPDHASPSLYDAQRLTNYMAGIEDERARRKQPIEPIYTIARFQRQGKPVVMLRDAATGRFKKRIK